MGHSIYLADDEKSIRELLHSFLASDGYTVRSFESGDALLEAFRQEPAELVILDIMMPGTDGLAVCRELRSVSDIPIILLTAKDSELDYVMGISQGSDDYLTKPFRPTILLMKVKALLRRVEMDRGKTAAAEDELHYGDIRYSATENTVFCGSTIVALTPYRAVLRVIHRKLSALGAGAHRQKRFVTAPLQFQLQCAVKMAAYLLDARAVPEYEIKAVAACGDRHGHPCVQICCRQHTLISGKLDLNLAQNADGAF